MILDLGCGGRLHGDVGIDQIGPPNSTATYVLNLGFDPIPLPDNSCDGVVANHFMEHVPFEVWYKEDGVFKRHFPFVYLLNEVYRVLKNRGLFKMVVPLAVSNFNGYANMQMWQDPSHVMYFTPETPNYISGDYYSFHQVYGHTSRFEKLSQSYLGTRDWMMDLELVAVKDVPEDTGFTYLNYDPVVIKRFCPKCDRMELFWNRDKRAILCHACNWVEFYVPNVDLRQ